MNAQNKTDPNNQSEELGRVTWNRNYEEALSLAENQGKSVLILFQEVPGCATCRNYGHNVLSHPLMVEAIENEFIPLAIYNNEGGEDRKILAKYNEPTWNNPVVRIVDAKGDNLVKRVAGNYSALGLFEAMKTALIRQNRPLPGYMKILGEELKAAAHGNVQQADFKMYCFWSGEGHLGRAEGVIATQPGFMSGHEVVRVWYDAEVTNADQLGKHAKQASCSPIASKSGFRADKDPQYYLKQTDYRFLPLSPLQKTRINSAIGKRGTPEVYLSPLQKRWLSSAKETGKVRYAEEFNRSWWEMAANR